MARPLFEQYKDALRRGHLALLEDELDAALDPSGDGGASAPAKPADEPEVPASDGRWPAIDLPSPPAPPLAGPPPDPALLQAEAEAFIDAGDEAAARDPLLLAVAVHRDA